MYVSVNCYPVNPVDTCGMSTFQVWLHPWGVHSLVTTLILKQVIVSGEPNLEKLQFSEFHSRMKQPLSQHQAGSMGLWFCIWFWRRWRVEYFGNSRKREQAFSKLRDIKWQHFGELWTFQFISLLKMYWIKKCSSFIFLSSNWGTF